MGQEPRRTGALFALNPAGTLPVLTGPCHLLDLILLVSEGFPEGFLVSTLPGRGHPAYFLTSGPGDKAAEAASQPLHGGSSKLSLTALFGKVEQGLRIQQ